MMDLKQIIKYAAQTLGVQISRNRPQVSTIPDVPNEFINIFEMVNKYTMSSPERVTALLEATRYIVSNGIEGDFVECGVWRGGSMMAVAIALKKYCKEDRNLYLYDTFEGMPFPGVNDKTLHGIPASSLLKSSHKRNKSDADSIWCYASIEDVQRNIRLTSYPSENIHFIQGKVEDTLPEKAPEKIALLRLDTDWYESTVHEMEHLFPRLVRGGVLIVDDYGHWQGAKKAIDEYVEKNKVKLLLNRIDYTGRIAVKID